MKKVILLLNLLIINYFFSCENFDNTSGNKTTISGQILHEEKGVPGVTISVKERKTETNFNGNYSISVSDKDSILVFQEALITIIMELWGLIFMNLKNISNVLNLFLPKQIHLYTIFY